MIKVIKSIMNVNNLKDLNLSNNSIRSKLSNKIVKNMINLLNYKCDQLKHLNLSYMSLNEDQIIQILTASF